MKDKIAEILTHPLTAVVTAIGAIGQLGFAWFDPVWGLLATTSGMWFPAIAVSAGTILPELGLSDLGTQVLFAAAILFVTIQLDKGWDRAKKYLRNR